MHAYNLSKGVPGARAEAAGLRRHREGLAHEGRDVKNRGAAPKDAKAKNAKACNAKTPDALRTSGVVAFW